MKMKGIINYRAVPIFFLMMVIGILSVTLIDLVTASVILAIGVVLFLTAFTHNKLKIYRVRILVCLIALSIGISITAFTVKNHTDIGNFHLENAEITGYVNSDTPFENDGRVFGEYVYIENVSYCNESGYGRLKGILKLKISQEFPSQICYIGDKITVRGNLSGNRLIVTDNFSISDKRKNVNYISTDSKVLTLDRGRLKLKDKIKISIKNILYKNAEGNSAETIYAMIFGDKSNINKIDKEAFNEIGIAHIFAVSGMHIAILAGILNFILKKLRVNKYINIAVITTLLLFFAYLCNFSTSVLRAIIMVFIFKISEVTGYRNDSISTLTLAGIVILLIYPLSVFDVSFLMSFLAVTGLIFFNLPIRNFLLKLKLPEIISKALSTSISVNICILPVMLYFYGKLSLIFPISNFLILPIFSIIFPIIVVLSFIGLIIPQISYALIPINYVVDIIADFAKALSVIKFLEINTAIPWIFVGVYLAAMLIISPFVMISTKLKKITVSVFLTVGLMFSVLSIDDFVNNGDSVVTVSSSIDYDYVMLGTDNGEHYLVLNGKLNREGLKEVVEYMNDKKIYGLDGIIKNTFTEKGLRDLRYFIDEFNAKKIYVRKVAPFYSNLLNADFEIAPSSKKISVNYNGNDEVIISMNGINIFFADNVYKNWINYPLCDYHIVYGVTNNLPFDDYYYPDYIVNTKAYTNYVHNSVPNYFTFKLKNGKIKKRELN